MLSIIVTTLLLSLVSNIFSKKSFCLPLSDTYSPERSLRISLICTTPSAISELKEIAEFGVVFLMFNGSVGIFAGPFKADET